MRLFCACLLLMVTACNPAYAESLSVITGAWSHHGSGSGYNEEHEALGLSYSTSTTSSLQSHSILTFNNSYYVRSYAYTYESFECGTNGNWRACLGWKAGATTGYKEDLGYSVLPVVGLGGSLTYHVFMATVMYIPFADVFTFNLSTEVYSW
jgi:hypothetical protein